MSSVLKSEEKLARGIFYCGRTMTAHRKSIRACDVPDRGGAGISKVVRLLQIKDHRRACAWGGEGVQQRMCGSENYLWSQIEWVQMKSAPGSRSADKRA